MLEVTQKCTRLTLNQKEHFGHNEVEKWFQENYPNSVTRWRQVGGGYSTESGWYVTVEFTT